MRGTANWRLCLYPFISSDLHPSNPLASYLHSHLKPYSGLLSSQEGFNKAPYKLVRSLSPCVCIWVRLSSICASVMKHYSFISLTIHLSILRSQRYHVDRATNPENMSNLAVNKEWASTRLSRARCLLPSPYRSPTCTHTLTHMLRIQGASRTTPLWQRGMTNG